MPITLITGGNKGLGYESARRLIELGHTIYIGARNAERGQAAANKLGAQFLLLGPLLFPVIMVGSARFGWRGFRAREPVAILLAMCVAVPVGFALFFHNFSTFLGRPGIYLEDLFVVPEHRGRGVGRALLKKLARLAVERFGPPARDQRTLLHDPADARAGRLREETRQARAAAGPDAVLRVLQVAPGFRVPERRAVLAPFER